MSSSVLAYAFLKAAFGRGLKSPIDAVEPLVKRALLDLKHGQFEQAKVQTAIKKYFGVEIPLNVIRYTFKNISANTDLISLNKTTFIYERTKSEKGIEDVLNMERESKAQINRIKAILFDVIEEYSRFKFQAEEVLEEWLDKSAISFLGGKAQASNISNQDSELNRIVAIAINDPEHGKTFIKDLTDVALGDALLRAITEITEYDKHKSSQDMGSAIVTFQSKMKGVEVYFDTKLVLRVLGYVNDEMEKSTNELINLCKSLDAKICIFSHTVSEIKKIINRVASGLVEGRQVDGDLANHAFQRGISAGELLEYVIDLDDKLKQLGFEIKDAPTVELENSINESYLDTMVGSRLNQESDDARIADVNSICAIYRLRKGEAKRYLEKCNAIFITPNKALADTATSFFKNHYRDEGESNRVQHCMTDVVFATRLWTKLPTSLDKLPKNQIVAHAMSNLSINKEVKSQFQKHIGELIGEGKLTEQEGVQVKLYNYTEKLISLSEYASTPSKDGAECIAKEIITKQGSYINSIIEDNEEQKKALESQLSDMESKYEREKQTLESDNVYLTESLNKKVEEGRVKISYMEMNLARIEARCGKISRVLTNSIFLIAFLLVYYSFVINLDVTQYLMAHFDIEKNDTLDNVLQFVSVMFFTIISIYGVSRTDFYDYFYSKLRGIIIRIVVGNKEEFEV
ncbi:hypothetical protein [Pseudoalteromonas ardens]|uniref:Uncharacterized protein n=1 Tax=Pseudoalteromonas rubra TaxID=43658 RepID=A0A0L0ETB4_9GAMM|nr:hypothetical protein [Pseudoalteromonas sp. R96]KNC67654.1 hypothetical protein AC626_09495 [Pseudoalteromonas rubra]MDK1310560.1 hypothetical protein [Pseudoalteromonas sp. R96]